MIAILEKYEHNQDFHQIVDFVKASHIRIETTKEGTKILATVDGKLKTVSESSIRGNLKLNDEAGIKGEGSETLIKPHHTPFPEALQTSHTTHSSPSPPHVPTKPLPTVIPTDTPQLRHYTKRARIAQSSALLLVADEPASPIGDDSQGEACPIDFSLEADQDRANIPKTSTLPSDSTAMVTSLAVDEGSMQQKLDELMALVKLLEDREEGGIAQSRNDAPIKRKRLDEGEESAKRVGDDTEEMATVLTSIDRASILTSGGFQVVPTAAEVATTTVYIPTGSEVVSTASPTIPTASPIFTTATESTPYIRRKGKETIVESKTLKKKKVQKQIDVQLARELEEEMARDAQRMNEQIAQDAKIEYYQFTVELPIEIRIELISDLVKYQDHYAKILKYQTQQRKPLSRKQQKEFYMSVLNTHAGWKARHFKGMTLEEIKEKFDPVWKQFQDFIPIGSKEET
nr:hypothetical protein [Tanacetum cinerariifolium]